MAMPPLLLAARELVRGSTTSLPPDAEVAAFAASHLHIAVVFRSRTERNCVRLGVFTTDDKVDKEKVALFLDLASESDNSRASEDAESQWAIVWSPDVKFLVVSGGSGGIMWVLTCPHWLDCALSPRSLADSSLLLPINPSNYLTRKHWNSGTNIVKVFFPMQSGSKMFVLSGDGVWLNVSVQLAKLALIAMEKSASEEMMGIFSMQVSKKLTEWHGGITAACYSPENCLLVISGGVRDPSADLVRKQASSLSVWKVKSDKDGKESGELLDFTLLVEGKSQQFDDETNKDETMKSSVDSATTVESSGLLMSVKDMFFGLAGIHAGSKFSEDHLMRGCIRHIALAPNGNFVSMVDDLGRIAIRKIDACADVLKWQEVRDKSISGAQGVALKSVVWLTSDLMGMMFSSDNVIFARFETHFDEKVDTGGVNGEILELSSRLEFIPAKFYRPALAVSAHTERTLAFDATVTSPGATNCAAFTANELVLADSVWAVNDVESLSMKPFIELLMNEGRFEDALETVALQRGDMNDMSADDIHRHVWMRYRINAARLDESVISGVEDVDLKRQNLILLTTRPPGLLQREDCSEFCAALGHLRAISDKGWVLDECLHLIADDSFTNMKCILDLALDALVCMNGGEKVDAKYLQKKVDLQRYIYRLETLRLIVCEEDGMSAMPVAADNLFDGATFALFRSLPMLSLAKQFAREGRVTALKVVLHRNGWNLLPYWMDVLEQIPSSVSPFLYAELLPVISAQKEKYGCIHTFKWSNDDFSQCDDDYDSVAPSEEHYLHDITVEEQASINNYTSIAREEHNVAYGEWLSRRILELDTRYGQLTFAYQLSRLAFDCLSGWVSLAVKQPLEELIMHTERLHNCVHVFHLPACCLLPLNEWSTLSMHDQAVIVVGANDRNLVDDVAFTIVRLEKVFVTQRRDRMYALDDMLSWLAQTVSLKYMLPGLTLAAEIIKRSNPSIELSERWIQSDTLLIDTALSVVYSVSCCDYIEAKAPNLGAKAYMQSHGTVVEQLWTIFQSLPIRKENDPPGIAQLQAAVGEMEGLLIAVDVLSKYGVARLPSQMRYQMLASSDCTTGDSKNVDPHELVKRMCAFAFSSEQIEGKEYSNERRWRKVLQDAVKLKELAFGERLSQEVILYNILKHLLVSDRVDVGSAQDVVNYWIASDEEAVERILDTLFVATRAKLDSITGYHEDRSLNAIHTAALNCISIARQLLSLPIWDEGDRAVSTTKEYYEEAFTHELDLADGCELLDLLTHGTVKMSPPQLRISHPQENVHNIRLDALFQVFLSNPSNYKPSRRAKDWLAQRHAFGINGGTNADSWSEPLSAVMQLARLLHIETEKLKIWMKGAYAALYCIDYDVACDLTMEVITIATAKTDYTADRNGSGDKVPLLHLVSLVLDLVSASSFHSWGKKRNLCCALLSASSISSTDLFAHQVTDLVLRWFEKIDAVYAVMVELGLSDDDLEQQRLTDEKKTNSNECAILNELEGAVAVMVGKKEDRRLILRLLQRGIRLAVVLSGNSVSVANHDISESVLTFLQQMVRICVQEATELVPTSSDIDSADWRQYMDLAFGYLMWLGTCSEYGSFEAFCVDEVLSPLFIDQSGPMLSDELLNDTSPRCEVMVGRLHDFFLLQAAQANAATITIHAGALPICRERPTTLPSSYEFEQIAARDTSIPGDCTLGDSTGPDEIRCKTRPQSSEQQNVMYLSLAQRCQDWLMSQKKSQELGQMTTFLGNKLNAECFLQDECYREEQILLLATKREHFPLSRQLAVQYGIDEYGCLLAYIKSVLLAPPDCFRDARRKQLDEAFSIDQTDVLEEALQRPIRFGNFLLKSDTEGGSSLYDLIDGTDHVGVLLVLRMILESSKRIREELAEQMSPHDYSSFPLAKVSIDRITLLFMCFKKLIDIGDSCDVLGFDLKLIGSASTTRKLLTPTALLHADPDVMASNRQMAVEAVRPLLTGRTVKVATKILRKLHNVTPSAMILIYINDLLMNKWREDGATATSDAHLSEVAFRAYESFVPCLSVLSNEHLMLFHYLFLNGPTGKHPPDLVTHLNLAEEFYGQQLSGLQHFGGLLAPEKRVDFVTDTLIVFQSKYNSWQSFGARSNVSSSSSTASSSSISWDPTQYKQKEQELSYLERDLAANMCCLLLHKIDKHNLTFTLSESMIDVWQSPELIAAAIKAWFAMDPLQQAANDEVFDSGALIKLCQHVASVDLSSLIMELVLRTGGNKMNGDSAATVIAESYKTAVANLVNRYVNSEHGGQKHSERWVDSLVRSWIRDTSTPRSWQEVELGDYVRTTLRVSRDRKSDAHALCEHAVMLLVQSPSALLKEIGSTRQSEMYSPSDGIDASNESVVALVRETVSSQLEQLVLQTEDQRKWKEAAALSHVLQSCEAFENDCAKLATRAFGLHVKSVWSALLMEHNMAETKPQLLFDIPSPDVSNHFTAVFQELLSFVEARACDGDAKALQFAKQATVALSNLLDRRAVVQGDPPLCSTAAWQNEQKLAVQARIWAQFHVGDGIERPPTQKSEATCWSALFARGIWDAHLLDWYTTHAYAELSGDEEGTEMVVLAHWETSKADIAIQLLLMCPFDELRKKYTDRLLHAVRQLPQDAPSWSTVMEFALLRFDVAVLIQHDLHSSVVAFLLQDVNKEPALWTSSGAYVVCALVMQGEFAAAGRLTCALRHAHPLLWDVENARLLLSSYLRTLASLSVQHSTIYNAELSHMKHEVYVQTSCRFAKAFD
uniref:RZZ complex subunit KNTC1/ROD C-terminal domain-containing protein n=1 Tax=Peronospora matthiolae TaxID=2874970 RepID=A0AAV1VPI2_9STRA